MRACAVGDDLDENVNLQRYTEFRLPERERSLGSSDGHADFFQEFRCGDHRAVGCKQEESMRVTRLKCRAFARGNPACLAMIAAADLGNDLGKVLEFHRNRQLQICGATEPMVRYR